MKILETDRLLLRELTPDDAAFILVLLNEPGWLQFIGDKNVHSLDDARNYIFNGPMAMYRAHGLGLYLVEQKTDGVPIGMCGLIKRDWLDDIDIGFAFLSQFGNQGFAAESAAATLEHARKVMGLKRIVAITTHNNLRSIRLLEKIGLVFEDMIAVPYDTEKLALYGCVL